MGRNCELFIDLYYYTILNILFLKYCKFKCFNIFSLGFAFTEKNLLTWANLDATQDFNVEFLLSLTASYSGTK